VTWKARTSVFVLVVLTGLPVSGTMCAYFCHASPQRADRGPAHHGDAACAQSSESGAAAQLRSVADHDCRTHALTAQPPATFAFERSGGALLTSPLAAAVDRAATTTAIALRPPLGQASPRGTPPLTATPSILRV